MSPVKDGELVFKRVSVANVMAHSESLLTRAAAGSVAGHGSLVRKCVADVESADVRICKRLAHGNQLLGDYYELTSELLARRPTLLVPPFKSSLTYDGPTAAYRFDLHGDLSLQLSHALHSTELLEMSHWWARINAGQGGAAGSSSTAAEEALVREQRWRRAAEAALRQTRVSAEADRAALESADSRILSLEAHLLRQSKTVSRLLAMRSSRELDDAGMRLDEMRACLHDLDRSTKALLGMPPGDAGDADSLQLASHGVLLATEEGTGNFVETVYATEDEARAAARSTWVSYVLFDLTVPWQPREIGDGGLGFSQDSIRAHVKEKHRLGPAHGGTADVPAAEGAPQFELGLS